MLNANTPSKFSSCTRTYITPVFASKDITLNHTEMDGDIH